MSEEVQQTDTNSGTLSLPQLAFACPECQRLVTASRNQIGKDIECRACSAMVSVPGDTFVPRADELSNSLPDSRNTNVGPKLQPFSVPNALVAQERSWEPDAQSEESHLRALPFSRYWAKRVGLIIGAIGVACIGIGIIATHHFEEPVSGVLVKSHLEPGIVLLPDKTADKFLDPREPLDERIALLREPFDEAIVRRELEACQADLDSGVESIRLHRQGQMLDVGYHDYHVFFKSGSDRYVCVVEEADGYKVDWDVFASADRADLEAPAEDAQLGDHSVLLRPSAFYNREFDDRDKYAAFALTLPDQQQDYFGYAERGTRTEEVLTQVITHSQRMGIVSPVAVRLRLECVENSHTRRQFLISHVLSSAWVESRLGTLEDLWPVSQLNELISFDRMMETAAHYEVPLMYEQGLSLQGEDTALAARFFRRALELDKRNLRVRVSLAAALAELGKLEEAESHLRSVLEDDPTAAEARFELGNCAARKGNLVRALELYESTLEHKPDHFRCLNNTAWLLATHQDSKLRSRPRVVKLAERAVEVSYRSQPSALATLGVAYAAANRFDDAVSVTREALVLLERDSDPELEQKLTDRLILFEARQPYVPR